VSDPKEQHPIVEKVLSLLRIAPKFRNMRMPDPQVLYLNHAALQTVKEEFEKYFDSDELPIAIISLLQLANALGDEGHKDVAIDLIRIVVTGKEALKKRNDLKNRDV
jgi:hypothetical protein